MPDAIRHLMYQCNEMKEIPDHVRNDNQKKFSETININNGLFAVSVTKKCRFNLK